MSYVQKYYKDLFLGLLQDALANELISRSEDFETYIRSKKDISNFYVMLLSIHADVFVEVYEQITEVYNSFNIDKATGVDLDNIGAIVGVGRAQPTSASVEVTLKLSKPLEEDLIIPKGVHCITRKGVSYHTVEDANFPAGTNESIVQALSDNKGTAYKISAGELYKITSQVASGVNVSCTNNDASSGGTDLQSDSDYRETLKNWHLVHQKGNYWAYKKYFDDFQGLDDYHLIPNWDGSGTIKVVIDPGSDYLRNLIYDELQESVACIDDDLNVMAYIPKVIDIYARVNVDIDQLNPFSDSEKDNISSQIKTALKVFVDGGYRRNGEYYSGLKIGEDFIPHKASVFVDSEVKELKNIMFNEPSNYTVITDDEKAETGNITIEME